MKRQTLVILSALLFCAFSTVNLAAKERAIKVKLRKSEQPNAPVVAEVELYSRSYALVIGIDDYTDRAWPRLSGAVHDAELVAETLREKGFDVTFRKNLNSRELKQAFEEFFIYKGQDLNARLFVWFAGHGHTLHGEGFLIPSDAPGPGAGARFKHKALSIRRFGEYVRQANSKHALAVFDSCFAGTIFDTQRTSPPPAVTRATTLPVRQFISSGDSNQKVSDDGRFRKLFIRALRGEERADANNDGYLTGSELGLFLTDRLTNLTRSRQTPRYGKLRDEDWDRGDFVFQIAGSGWGQYGPGATTLSVKTNVEGARVLIGGQYVGETPLKDHRMNPGQHRIVVEKSGYETYRDTVDMDRGRALSLRVMLKEAKATKARLYVETEPSDATVRILNISPRFYQGMALEPGRYHVEVSADGYKTQKQWVVLSPGEEERLTISLTRIKVARARRAGDSWKEPVTGMEFVWIPKGCFEMGQTEAEKQYLIKEAGEETYNKYYGDELPRHRVCVDGFWMGKHEVTRGQFRAFVRDTGYQTDAEKKGKAYVFNKETDWKWKALPGYDWKKVGYSQDDTHPVASVSWNDAVAFGEWISNKSGKKTGLPTEAQWEYAARGGVEAMRFWGSDDSDACQYANVADKGHNWSNAFPCDDGYQFTAPSGNYKPNPFGLYDMLGNVWEWCADRFGKDYYSRSPEKNPQGPSSGRFRVLRGGAWNNLPRNLRSVVRNRGTPDDRGSYFGFRLAVVPPQ